jgi:uroporphyrinogen III methyltransferase / synthase
LWYPLLAAMGPGTAEELTRYGRRADLVPSRFRAESLADALTPEAAGKRFLLARASRGRELLTERLTAAGAVVEQIVVYTSDDVEQPDPKAAAMLHAGEIDWITVTSSAIARSLAKLFGDDLRRSKLASISPITSDVLRELGHEPAVEAAEYTSSGLTAEMVAKIECR